VWREDRDGLIPGSSPTHKGISAPDLGTFLLAGNYGSLGEQGARERTGIRLARTLPSLMGLLAIALAVILVLKG